MATDPARLVAFDVLRAVADQDAYANIELSRMLRERRLSARETAVQVGFLLLGMGLVMAVSGAVHGHGH